MKVVLYRELKPGDVIKSPANNNFIYLVVADDGQLLFISIPGFQIVAKFSGLPTEGYQLLHRCEST